MKTAKVKRLRLIDGSNLLHRMFHVKQLQELENGTVFGLLNSMVSISRADRGQSRAVVCWDKGLPKRALLDPTGGYKNWKKAAPEDRELLDRLAEYKRAKMLCHDLLLRAGIPSLIMDGYEADDLLCYTRFRVKAGRYSIVTEDRDLLQLLDDETELFKPIRNETWDRERLREHYGFSKDLCIRQFILMKAMMGDASDGITGVPGIGEKTALTLSERLGAKTPWEALNSREEKVLEGAPIVWRNVALIDISRFVHENQAEIAKAMDPLFLCSRRSRTARKTDATLALQRLGMKTILGKVDDLMTLSPELGDDDLRKPVFPVHDYSVFSKKGFPGKPPGRKDFVTDGKSTDAEKSGAASKTRVSRGKG